jgi:hypothetical protein
MSCYKNGIFIINVDLHSGSSINAGLAWLAFLGLWEVVWLCASRLL